MIILIDTTTGRRTGKPGLGVTNELVSRDVTVEVARQTVPSV